MLGSLCQSAIGHSEAVEFLPNSERREPSIDGILTWDAIAKVHHAKLNELDVGFEFYFQNKTSKEVQIKRAISPCGCTVAKLPKLPWVIKPAQKGSIPVTMDLRGKSGVTTKTIQLVTDQGIISLKARVAIGLVSGPPKKRSKEERAANLRAAAANRQAIFTGQVRRVPCHPDNWKTRQATLLDGLRDLPRIQKQGAIRHRSPPLGQGQGQGILAAMDRR